MIKKILISLGIYLLLGIVWVFSFNLYLGIPLGAFIKGIRSLENLSLILIWPLQILQALGLFGLSFR